jgi:poly(3-hydroxybutyrate) depolymerase
MFRHGWMLAGAMALLLGGCAVPQPQNTIEQERYEVNPETGKAYWLFVPHSYRHDQPMPLIVSCHGTPPYDVANHHIREWKWLAEQNGCIVVAPDVVGTDGIFGDGPVGYMLADERAILSIISALGYRFNIDRANIMISGFSGGGFPTYWVGLRNPDIFSVVAGRNCNFNEGNLDGWYPPEAKETRVLVYYGENDPGTIAAQSRAGIEYFRLRGFNISTATIPGAGHERHPEVAMKFFRENMRPARPSLPSAGLAAAR